MLYPACPGTGNPALAVQQVRCNTFVHVQAQADSQHITVAEALGSGISQPPTGETGLLEGSEGGQYLRGGSTTGAPASASPGERQWPAVRTCPGSLAYCLQQETSCLLLTRSAAHPELPLSCIVG